MSSLSAVCSIFLTIIIVMSHFSILLEIETKTAHSRQNASLGKEQALQTFLLEHTIIRHSMVEDDNHMAF